ncbi:hypothetical protein [Planctomicrobium sp. SH527]|uniref:hypothetical protein n=1 Tax=Planctomicrobium sp. SH527 TaxID=3448123 RepID=UPI003F5B8A93
MMRILWHLVHQRLFLLGILFLSACHTALLPPPVVVSYRDSLWGAGKVVQIFNGSSHHLYNVCVVGRNLNEVASASVKVTDHLPPGGTVEVGWLEFANWIPRSGETIEVYADNYVLPVISVIP